MAPPTTRKPPDVSAANKERNEYIPSFISKKPFYVDDSSEATSDYLEHQRLQKSASAAESRWYDRGKKQGPAATKFRKGACENCGALTHKAKDCLSRPRKQGAKWTGKDIQADEVVEDVDLGWDAKRDRWNGYDSKEYNAVVSEYNELEEMKRLADRAQAKVEEGDEDDKDGGAKYEEETDMGRQQSTSTRNLRLREDTAKYLLNLDLDSAKYDPKTRSMVDSGATADQAAALVAEEGFMKASGDAAEFAKAQKYAWETQERGGKNKLHLQANPTSGEFLRKKELQEAETRKAAQKKALLDKYGTQEHLQNVPVVDAGITESERYVEYDERGKIKGASETVAKSKYPEDIFTNNHTTVWGSWWSNFQWGYACCHSTVKNSYCTGDAGKQAIEDSTKVRTGVAAIDASDTQPRIRELKIQEEAGSGTKNGESVPAIKKRTLEEMTGGITEAEIDEYRRKKQQADDPMAKMRINDEVVH